MMRTGRALRARLRGLRLDDDRGISTLEVLIMFPILVISMFMAIQVAMDYYAKEVALAAAEHGVQVGRLTGRTADARAATVDYLHEHAGWLVTNDTNISTLGSSGTQIRVTVSGTPVKLISVLAGVVKVKQTATGAVEKFTYDPPQP